jgi:hypothetical protein
MPLRNEHHHLLVIELRTEEPGVAALGIVARRKEPLAVELIVHTKQQAAQAAESRGVGATGAADDELG